VRRQQVVEQFADLIEGMYASGGGQ
jgi:hypothetical protein